MKHLFMVFTYLVSLTNKSFKHNGMKVVVAENLLLKHQLFVLTRSRRRAPNLSSFDRFFLFESSPHQAGGRSPSTVYTFEISPSHGEEKISLVVFVIEQKEARPEGPFPGND